MLACRSCTQSPVTQRPTVLQAWFIAFYGSNGFCMPYFNLYLRQLGYDGWHLGWISALRPFVGAACGPLWAARADHTQAHRAIFLTTFLLSAIVREMCTAQSRTCPLPVSYTHLTLPTKRIV